jgi:RNA polymerase sigma factor (sigma-70 family)
VTTDRELLCRYVEADCEDAFAELVRRYVGLVYSAALRQVNGDAHLAQDVAQSVFTDLARKANTLLRRQTLTGWLYSSTHFAAAKAVRTESRRRAHEQKAHTMHELLQSPASEMDWDKLVPVLDEVMYELNDSEREMILLRYFQNRRLVDIGEEFGLNEDTARKRVERALEKLRGVLLKRGIRTTASLTAVISANAVQTAPPGLAATLSTGALGGTALKAASAAALTKTIAMTTMQKTLIAAALAAVAGTGFYEAHQASRFRDQVQKLEQQQASLTEQIEQITSDNTNLSNQLAQASRSPSVNSERLRELLRLRGEVGMLRRQQREFAQTLAAAQTKGLHSAIQSGSAAPLHPNPFQVQLVLDGPGDNSESMTNNASGANAELLHLDKTPLMDYTAIRSASVTKNPSSGEPEINVELSQEGGELFAAVTKEHINQRLAIVLNGQLYAAPVIRSEISSGKAQITGNFTEEEAAQLAAKINEAVP